MTDPSPFTSAIGPIVTGRDVEVAAIRVLKRWSGTYLAECERQRDYEPGSLPRIRAWTASPTLDKWPEDQLPVVIVISPGLIDGPSPDGRGLYRARFSLGIAPVTSAAGLERTAELAKLYTAALRSCLIQHQSLEGFALGVEWLDESYDDLPLDDGRTLGAGQAIFAVEVGGIARRWNGPSTPNDPAEVDTTPLPTDPTVETVDIATQPIPIDGG